MDKVNKNILSPFVIERDDEYEICEVSIEQKDGWKAIPILIDSGASDSVVPPGLFPQKFWKLTHPKQVCNTLLRADTKL